MSHVALAIALGLGVIPTIFTVAEDAGIAGPDWDIFWRWPGDAESVRSVARQVQEFDRDNGRP